MRIAVTGASGNLGSALLRRLRAELAGRPGGVVGISRRAPSSLPDGVDWRVIDVSGPTARAGLTDAFRGCDAVVHLAWLIQPGHDEQALWRTNVQGSRNVLDAVRDAGVGQVVVASSVGAYSPGRKDVAVGEEWPTGGIPTSSYSRHKVEVERMLDDLAANPAVVVSRIRPALVFQGQAGPEIAGYFLGPLVPTGILGRLRLPALLLPRSLTFQAIHADDVASAFWTVLDTRSPGAFNAAADPPLTPDDLAHAVGAGRSVPLPRVVLRAVVQATWRLHLQPTDAGWIDLATQVPLMSTERLRALGWVPTHAPTDALGELITGMRRRTGDQSLPPLST